MLSPLQHLDERLPRDVDVGDSLHPPLALRLALQQLHLPADVAAVLESETRISARDTGVETLGHVRRQCIAYAICKVYQEVIPPV